MSAFGHFSKASSIKGKRIKAILGETDQQQFKVISAYTDPSEK